MRLIRNIKRTPANAASMKMAHFSNIGVTEVFLEATPTTMITTVIFVLSLQYNVGYGGGLSALLVGRMQFPQRLLARFRQSYPHQ